MLKLHLFLWLCFFMLGFTIEAVSQTPVGKWNFDAADNVLKAEIGTDLEQVGAALAIPGPNSNNGAVRIGIGSHFIMTHGIEPSGGDEKVNEWSLLIDFRISQLDIWHTFFQTDPTNSTDGDCFKNPSGHIGVWVTGYSADSIKVDQWYRLVISVEMDWSYNYYLDGALLHEGTPQDVDDRFALESILLLFADENEEDGEIDIAEVAIWDYPLSDEEVKNLGGVNGDEAAIDERDRSLVSGYKLEQNYPNPFNPETHIKFDIPKETHVRLDILNTHGQRISTLINNNLFPGSYTEIWDSRNAPTGVYFCRLTMGDFSQTRKMLLVR
jgi:hypothetical protein